MELRLILEILWRRRRIVVVTFLAILAMAVLCAKILPPTYKASLQIISEKPFAEDYIVSTLGLPAMSSGAGMSSSTAQDDGDAMDDVLAQATATPVLQSVIDRLQLRDSKGRLMKPDKIIDAPFISLSSTVSPYFSVDDTEDSNILDLEAQAGDRDEAAMMANDLAQAILEASIKERRDGYTTVRKFLETKINGVSTDYESILAEVEAFKLKEKTVDLDIETQTLINKMVDRIKEKEDLLSTLAEYRAREDVIRKQLQGETPEALSESTMQDNAHIAALKGDLSDLEVGLVGLLKQKTELHPDVQLQRERIRAVEEELKKEIAALPASNGDLQDSERLVAATLANIDVLDKQIETFSTQLYSLPGKESAYAKLSVKLADLQTLYTSFSQRLYEINLADAMTVSCMRVLGPAVAPDIDDASAPSLVLCVALGIFLGVFFGFALAFLVDYVDDSARNLSDFDKLDAPLLGVIPTAPSTACLLDYNLRVSKALTEPFRLLVGRILGQSGKSPKVIVVTSTDRKEGKTVATANLALTLTSKGLSVIIVDHSASTPRLSSLVGAASQTPDTVAQTTHERLSIVTAGPGTAVSLIQKLSANYDVVLVDTEPILYSSDAAVLAGCSDLAIVAVRDGRANIADLKQSIANLRNAGAKAVGLLPIGYSQSNSNKLIRFLSNL